MATTTSYLIDLSERREADGASLLKETGLFWKKSTNCAKGLHGRDSMNQQTGLTEWLTGC
jgi:hypothetical protein